MPKIFISDRWEDSEHATGRIYDRLELRFGADNVFFDVDAIRTGVDFRRRLAEALGQSDVVLVVIGEAWLGARYRDGPRAGQRRLDDPKDFVRVEVEAALARGIPVV